MRGILVIALAAGAVIVTALLFTLTDLSPMRKGGLGERRVGVLSEHAPASFETHFSGLAAALDDRYALEEVNLGTPDALDGLDVLIVLGPGHIPDAQLFEIDQFIMRGGRAAFLLDGASVSADRMAATVVRGNLFAYAEAYGATVNPDLVVDPLNGSASYPDAAGRPYAFWPAGTAQPGSRDGVRLPDAGDVVFAWTSSVSLSDRLPKTAAASVVARSTGDAWTTIAFADLDPTVTPKRTPDGPFDEVETTDGLGLAVAIEGTLVSAFDGMPVIVEREGGSVEFTDPPGRLARSEPTRVFVAGSSRMFDDFVLGSAPANLEFLLSAVEWLAR
ncbi:MAG: Gldg family protein [Candidatus Eisenbacteria bacterium]